MIFLNRIINLIEENFVKKIKDDFNNNIYKNEIKYKET